MIVATRTTVELLNCPEPNPRKDAAVLKKFMWPNNAFEESSFASAQAYALGLSA